MSSQKLPLRVGVGVIILNNKNKVFVGKRKDNPVNKWQMPQGGVDVGENFITAMKRELFEETGIKYQEFPILNWQFSQEYEIYKHWRYRYPPSVSSNTEHVFSVELPKKITVKIAPKEHRDFKWVPIEDAIKMVFSDTNAQALKKLNAKKWAKG